MHPGAVDKTSSPTTVLAACIFQSKLWLIRVHRLTETTLERVRFRVSRRRVRPRRHVGRRMAVVNWIDEAGVAVRL